MFNKAKPSDARIVKAVLTGARDDFALLVNRYLPMVNAVAFAQLGNPTDVDDIAQDAFLQAYVKLDTLRDASKFPAWIAAIARNRCMRLLRSRGREAQVLREAPVPEAAAAPDLDEEELKQLLQSQIAQLKTEFREVLLLHYFARKTTKEMAQILDISCHAAKKRLQRAREALGKELLAKLPSELRPERGANKRAKAVMAAIVAAQAPWASKTAGAAVGVSAAGGALKIAAGLTVAALAGLGLVKGLGAIQSDPTAGSPASVLVSTPQEQAEASVATQEDDVSSANINEDEAAEPEMASLAASEEDKPIPDDGKKRIFAKLEAPVSIEFEGNDLREITEFMSEYLKINVILDWAVIADKCVRPAMRQEGADDPGQRNSRGGGAPRQASGGTSESQGNVTYPEAPGQPWASAAGSIASVDGEYVTNGIVPYIRVTNAPLRQTLKALLKGLYLDFSVEPGYIWCSTSGKIRERSSTPPKSKIAEYNDTLLALEKAVDIEFEGNHIQEITDFLEEYLDISIIVDASVVAPQGAPEDVVQRLDQADSSETAHRAAAAALPDGGPYRDYVTDGIVPYVRESNKPLEEILDILCHPMGLDFVVEPGYIWISTPGKISEEITTPSKERMEKYNTLQIMDKPVSIEFRGDHLNTITDFIEEYLDVNIIIDSRVVAPKGARGAYCNRVTPEGAVTDGVVPYIRVTQLALRDCLPALLRPLNLTWSVENGFLWISTKERIQQDLFRVREEYTALLDETTVSMKFEGSHVYEIIDMLGDHVEKPDGDKGVAFLVDPSIVLAPGNVLPDAPYGKSGTVPHIRLDDVTLRSALNALLRPMGFDYSYRDGEIWISTVLRLRQGVVTREDLKPVQELR